MAKTLRIALCGVLLGTFASETLRADAPAAKPNIVFIFADDLGFELLPNRRYRPS